MSEQNARDTQFQGFAKALTEELKEVGAFEPTMHLEIALKRIEPIITRRAYDLAIHVLDQTGPKAYVEAILQCVPDMDELPKDQDMYLVDNGDCCGTQALEILEPPKEQE